MILPVLFAAALALAPQQPAATFTVAPADAAVPAAMVGEVRRLADQGLRQLADTFPGQPSRPFAIFIHPAAATLPPHIREHLHPGTPGLALLDAQAIYLVLDVMPRGGETGLGPVLTHELVHILLHQTAAPHGRRLPRWLHEGLAQALAKDTYLGAREEDLIWRASGNGLLPFSSLEDDFPRAEIDLRLAYGQSYSFVAWMVREYGVRTVLAAVHKVDGEVTFLQALVNVTGRDTNWLHEAWLDYLLNRSGARARALLADCFSFVMLLALPLLALAMIRRMSVDRRARQRLEQTEPSEPPSPPVALTADPTRSGPDAPAATDPLLDPDHPDHPDNLPNRPDEPR